MARWLARNEPLQVFVTSQLTWMMVLHKESQSGVNCTKKTQPTSIFIIFLKHVLYCIGVYMYSFNKQNLSSLIQILVLSFSS